MLIVATTKMFRSGAVALSRRVHPRSTHLTAVRQDTPKLMRCDRASFSSSSYHIEVSNVARRGVTSILITGPGVLGLLASMCCALASMGGSIRTLHAADSLKEEGVLHTDDSDEKPIRDVITVVNYKTGQAFADDELPALGQAILKSTQAPLHVVSVVSQELEKMNDIDNDEESKGKVTLIREKSFPRM